MISLSEYVRRIEEKQGVYDGCDDLARYIADLISKNLNKNFIVVPTEGLKFQNIFTKFILIYLEGINESIKHAQYHSDDIKNKDKVLEFSKELINWDNENNIFNFIELTVELSDDNLELDHYTIGHELNHAYEDYNYRLTHPGKSYTDYIDFTKYNKALKYTETDYFTNKPTHSLPEYVIGFIEYLSTGTETRAHVAQALMKFKDNLDKYDNFEDAIDWQKNNNKIFQLYNFLETKFHGYQKIDKLKEIMCNTYKDINNIDKNIDNDIIIRKIEKKLERFNNALKKHINIILKDYAKKNTI